MGQNRADHPPVQLKRSEIYDAPSSCGTVPSTEQVSGRMAYFACFGDSITSDQVTGTGTRVAELLDLPLTGNFACGYATMSDWHEDGKNITPVSLAVPMDTNTADNVLSNQVRRCLQYTEEHPDRKPGIIYIAAGINDGNSPCNRVSDDTDTVLGQEYGSLTRNSMAGALRWAVETLRSAYPDAFMFAASPLLTCGSGFEHMTREAVLKKREIIRKVAEYEKIYFIDATFGSGFSEQVAALHGGIHPDAVWKENIARFVAEEIRKQTAGYIM